MPEMRLNGVYVVVQATSADRFSEDEHVQYVGHYTGDDHIGADIGAFRRNGVLDSLEFDQVRPLGDDELSQIDNLGNTISDRDGHEEDMIVELDDIVDLVSLANGLLPDREINIQIKRK